MAEDERGKIIAGLFAVMTADCEDAAGLAADGQGRGVARDRLVTLAERIHSIAQRTSVITDAIAALLDGDT